jgi:hypothetical protein
VGGSFSFPLFFFFLSIWDLLCHEINDEAKCVETAGLERERMDGMRAFSFSFGGWMHA